MARRTPRPEATYEKALSPLQEHCEQCGQFLWVAHHSHRTVAMLSGLWRLTLVVRQCVQPGCPRFHQPYRPEEEGHWALPHGEFGLEVIALIGQWRFREHRSVPQMHRALQARGIRIAQRSLTLEGVLVGTPPAQGPFSPLLLSVHAVEGWCRSWSAALSGK